MDYSTGYSWSASGHNVQSNIDHYLLAQGQHPAALVWISAEWTNMNMSNKTTWSIVNPEKVSPVETYHGPLSNQTIIVGTTEVESITETTSVFQR